MTAVSDSKLYQLKISLVDSEPLIWRRLLVPALVSLADLHRVLQITMGWQNLAPYSYRIGQRRSDAEPALLAMPLHEIICDDLTQFNYLYDPRDGWLHLIEVEMVLPSDPEGTFPHCISGEKSCPPEACGGVWGYEELLDILDDVSDPQHEIQWDHLGSDFDPDRFDADFVNMQLHA